MTTHAPGKIFLADQRGLTTTPQFQRYSTFNFGTYQAEHREPLGRLYAVNEETLAGGQRIELPVRQDSQVLLLPVTGTVACGFQGSEMALINVEEIQLLNLPAGSQLTFSNPYQDELISFLHIWLAAGRPQEPASADVFDFDFQALENQLAELVPAAPATTGVPGRAFSLSLGRFAGRQEASYQLQKPEALFFAFVLAGAFEVAGRLLHEKDGLALWDVAAVELEALSNDALVVVLEVLG
jgi:hypothetical protein